MAGEVSGFKRMEVSRHPGSRTAWTSAASGVKEIVLSAGSGVTALHVAALKGSHSAVRELLRSGAAADAVTLSGVHNPQLSRGSTALHIAASRGHAGVVTALLEHQTGIPGVQD